MDPPVTTSRQADQVLEALEAKPELLKQILYRCIGKGHIGSALRDIHEDNTPIATPWYPIDHTTSIPGWARRKLFESMDDNYVATIQLREDHSFDWNAAGEHGTVDTFADAMHTADSVLRRKLWTLL